MRPHTPQFSTLPGRIGVGFLLLLLRVYRWFLSPFFGRQCRFQPTCSIYAQDALRRHGLQQGIILTLNRLRRCHPVKMLGANHGYTHDPVPPVKKAPDKT